MSYFYAKHIETPYPRSQRSHLEPIMVRAYCFKELITVFFLLSTPFCRYGRMA